MDQRMFDESFYVVDMEDVKEQDIEELKILITMIFNSSENCNPSNPVRKRSNLDTSELEATRGSRAEESSALSSKEAEKLFSKVGLRDFFIKECIKRIPERRQPINQSTDSFYNMSVAIRGVITSKLG